MQIITVTVLFPERTGITDRFRGNEIDEAEYKIYMRQNKSRIDKLKSKQACMNVAFEMKRLEIWYAQEMRKNRNDK